MHNNALLRFTWKHIEVNSYDPYSRTCKRAQKLLCKKLNCQEFLLKSKFKAWTQLKVAMKISELSQKSLFDFHFNGIIYYSQCMNNSKNHFLHLLFQVVNLSLSDMLQLDQIPC